MRKIFLVAGARPNFVKIGPLMKAFQRYKKNNFDVSIVNTGQHYDYKMSKKFFEDLNIPPAKFNLNVGSGSHAVQTAKVMVAFEKLVLKEKPDLIVVVGDVNSTLACALVGAKLRIPIAHVEAGLRSFDRTMPEEINRIVTDSLSDILFTTCVDANKNLMREGISRKKIHFVGNVMVDSLLTGLKKSESSQIKKKLELAENTRYILVTLHRPSNVDDLSTFGEILKAIEKLQKNITVIFPIHPRTQKILRKSKWRTQIHHWTNLRLISPLGYLDFIHLMRGADLVLTDSGGVQEETTILDIPCLTLRNNTERPITITHGTNCLIPLNRKSIFAAAKKIFQGTHKRCKKRPPLWDGKAALRLVSKLSCSNSF